MDRGKRPGQFLNSRSNKIYMDLKDILREHALPFLPAKSLFRFQAVCRDWKLQISTPFFAHNQSLSCRTITGVFCQAPLEIPVLISVDPKSCGIPDPLFQFLPEPFELRSSSNGLLCCQGRTGEKAYYICNPVTMEWKRLPQPNAIHGSDTAVVLVFEPSLLNFEAQYKVVCAFPSSDFDDATEFEIYSSKEGCWKTSGEICFAAKRVVPGSGVCADGVVYWRVSSSGLLAYDLIKDRSQFIQSYYNCSGHLGTIDGKLCKANVNGRRISVNVLANAHSNTMQMSSNAKMWEEKYTVVLDRGVVGDGNQKVVFIGEHLLVVQCGKKLYSFNLRMNETRELHKTFESCDFRCLPYVNSLVCI